MYQNNGVLDIQPAVLENQLQLTPLTRENSNDMHMILKGAITRCSIRIFHQIFKTFSRLSMLVESESDEKAHLVTVPFNSSSSAIYM